MTQTKFYNNDGFMYIIINIYINDVYFVAVGDGNKNHFLYTFSEENEKQF